MCNYNQEFTDSAVYSRSVLVHNLQPMKRSILFFNLCILFIIHSCNNIEQIEFPPSVTSINPASGGYGTELIITGSNFSSNPAENNVKIGGVNAEVKSAKSTTLTVLVPALDDGDLPVRVSTEAGSADAGTFKYIYDVFVAGTEMNNEGFQVAKYWKNGTPIELSDGKSTISVSSITVSGNTIYVVGTEYNASDRIIKLWINGTESNITSGTRATAFDIKIDGPDVYIAGYENKGSQDIATYWKNGIPTHLTDGSKPALLRSVAISGGNIYVAGYEYNESKAVAKYWKNGIPVVLTDGQKSASSRDIAIEGSDVYVCGVESENAIETAKFWKNGIETILGDKTNRSFTVAMAVKGSSTHITGMDNGVGRYWKNGVVTSFAANESEAYPMAVYLVNDDVFLAGSVGNGLITKAAYWKNGSQIILNDGTYSAAATSIYVR